MLMSWYRWPPGWPLRISALEQTTLITLLAEFLQLALQVVFEQVRCLDQ